MTPVLIAISFGSSQHSDLKWVAVAIAVIVAIVTASIRIFKYYDKWITYRTTCEALRQEIHFYRAEVGEYAISEDKKAVFVQRVESLISQENTLWLTVVKKEDTAS